MCTVMKNKPAVLTPEAYRQWLALYSPQLITCRRMACRMLRKYCGTREECFRDGRCRMAPEGSAPVVKKREAMTVCFVNPEC